ncbi:hypothetical protein [Endozoicomonas arenosclerae]|uniref:hypothetical protein n=1 Tax=Endozoicomonas arenosclerae TaxID=1633495 RepID=UPI000784A0FB|nr:hypothetical protein [Endozoicomonas arenosclerae]
MKTELNCFAIPAEAHNPHQLHPLLDWIEQREEVLASLNPEQKSALSRLVPLLLCGEQSAMLVFHNEYLRLSPNNSPSLQALLQIEADEFIHEQALQNLQQWLPEPEDIRQIKRRSQLFYARLHKSSLTIKQHFFMISQLDACVCLIMSAMAQSMKQNPILQNLFQLILKDEARHVYVSRMHARALSNQKPDDRPHKDLHQQLITLLSTEERSFRTLGVDTGMLFQRIEELAQKRIRS